ncbi:YihY/virulence factor BrkB family protein [Pseudochryseolinea flava]|uniref:YihY/virulence factor BrkB family protein n=1 Tax=Pseudochryseolinea flava TaxID=2059302 RepID=A0A364Y6S5_9BACT|nr:YihY/virulence factor BrkB family protein [Pseudochryseolinea flava]RAW02804.1 YihY/virulence factor BrkB family protein [Pseudochryseolinea flava]
MKYKHKRLLLQFNPARGVFTWMKRVRFQKYENVSLYKIFRLFIQNLMDDEILDRANGVAYNFILAVFPAIIFLFTLIPYANNFFADVTTETIMARLGEVMPPSMFEVISPTVLDIVSNQRGGLLSLGFVFSLYLSTNGTLALMRAFNACYRTVERRSGFKTRLIATGLTINLALVVFLAIVLLVVGQLVLDYITQLAWFDLSDFTVFLLFSVRFLVIFIVFFIAISTLYYFGPAIHYNWRFFSIGSFVATLLTIAVSYGFSYYVTNYSTYNKVYGSIGVLIAIMVWIQLITVVLLIGYEINASIHNAIRKQALWNARMYRKDKSKIDVPISTGRPSSYE